ncbi:MAG: hypothetical protein ACP5JG_06450 [Anaerolineae bacterium]
MPETRSPQRRRRASDKALTEELVKKVADRVYAMLIQDLTIERERHRPSSRGLRFHGGW